MTMKSTNFFFLTLIAIVLTVGCNRGPKVPEILNVSYDPTRQLYDKYNELFVAHWKETKGEDIKVTASHGGSGGQAKAVITGQPADVVTLALSFDIDAIVNQAKLLPEDWQKRLPNNSCPYTSTIVFLVRKGNPKQLNDWDDLVKEGIEIITPDPKTSGGARWNYLAAWGHVLKKELGSLENINDPTKTEQVKAANIKARDFVKHMFKNVKAMDRGARGSTQRFVDLKQGDVLLAWENEALLYQKVKPEESFEIVVPKVTILAEPAVALVDKNVDRRGTREIAEEYLKYLYEAPAQEVIAQNYYRPSNPDVAAQYADVFPKADTFRIDDVFGSWQLVQREHFDTDAIFDQIIMENAGR